MLTEADLFGFRETLGWRDGVEDIPAALVGVEQEYQLFADGSPLDFRDLIHSLPLDGQRLDPGDSNAYRLRSGLALTCDEAEAEVASPPIPVRPGFSAEVASWATSGRAQLEAILPSRVTVAGYSTHLSANLADGLREPVIEMFLARFAPPLMLLLGSPDGYGMYLRPRPGRLEACGDHVGVAALQAAAALLVGGVRACAAAFATGGTDALPPALAVSEGPATGRYGLYLGRRHAFGFDVYDAGLDARLPLARGGTISAGEHIALCHRSAHAHLDPDEPGLTVLEAMLAKDIPLPVQRAMQELPPPSSIVDDTHGSRLLDPVHRPRFQSRAIIATWDFAVFRLEGRRAGYACVPRAALATFLARLPSGDLDPLIEAFLETPPGGRRLAGRLQALEPGLWDEIGSPLGLLPEEPDPVLGTTAPGTNPARAGKGGRVGKVARPGKPVGARPGKPVGARPGKPLVPLARTRSAPSTPAPPLPSPGPPPLPPVPPPPPTEGPPGPPGPPAPTLPRPRRPLALAIALAAALGAIVAIGTVVGVDVGVFNGPDAASNATATATTAATVGTEVASPAASPDATAAQGTETPRPRTETPSPAATTTPAAGGAVSPTETPRPTNTPGPGATTTPVATETPRPTNTPGVTATPVPSATPSPTATCGPPGTVFACTPTPAPPTATRTPTPSGPPTD